MSRLTYMLGLTALVALGVTGCVERSVEMVSPDGKVVHEEHVLAPAVPHAAPAGDQPAPIDPPGPDRGPDIKIDGPRRSIDIDADKNGVDVDVDRKDVP